MKKANWRLTLCAALAVLALQACDNSPPQTTVHPPEASLPDDTVLRAPEGNPQGAATPSPDAGQAAAPQVAGTPPAGDAAPNGQTSVMGAPAGTSAAQAPGPQAPAGEGTAARTEVWEAVPPADGTGTPTQAPATGSPPANTQAQEKVSSADLPAVKDPGDRQGAQLLAQRPLEVPVVGIAPTALTDNFEQSRGSRRHEAIDILAPAGTPVVAVDDGRIAKLFTSKPGGLTIYQYDPQSRLAYYYAHLQRYADGVREGQVVHRGQVIGYVGSTGNADAGTPHLHFTVFRLGDPPKWWQGAAVNPYPALRRARAG